VLDLLCLKIRLLTTDLSSQINSDFDMKNLRVCM
jgi:hypothetical protein